MMLFRQETTQCPTLIAIKLFYYHNLKIVMIFFFSLPMCRTVALSSPVSRILVSKSNVGSRHWIAAYGIAVLWGMKYIVHSYYLGKLVKEIEKPSLAGMACSSPTVFTILHFSAVEFHSWGCSRAHVCLPFKLQKGRSQHLSRTDSCNLIPDKEFFSLFFHTLETCGNTRTFRLLDCVASVLVQRAFPHSDRAGGEGGG